MVSLSISAAILRMVFRRDEPIARTVNLGSAGFDLIVLSVLASVIRYRGYRDGEEDV